MMIDSLRAQLELLNEELAQLTFRDPLPLAFQVGGAEQDSLFLYGIVGGKDVGKTSLINRLAGARISLDTDILDEGTKIAVAYCHRLDIPALKKRLAADTGERIIYVSHDREELRNVVLVDFPDFDSRFVTHRDAVVRLGKHLQGIVWVVTPRKYGDHEFIEQLEAVAQSNENYHVVLNKVDQVETKAALETVRGEVTAFLLRECGKRNIPPPDRSRFWMLSALSPERFDFPQFYARMIRVHSPEEISKAKVKNLRAEFDKNLSRIRSHYALPEQIAEIERALEWLREAVARQFTDDYFETVRRRIVTQEAMRRRISSGIFAQRIEGWPLLRSLFYPLAGIVSVLGGRLVFTEPAGESAPSPRDLLRCQGVSAAGRMQKIRDLAEERFPGLSRHLGEVPDYSEPVDREFDRLLRDHEEQVTERLSENISYPGMSRKILVFLPLVWFPLLQPLLLQWSREEGHGFSFSAFGHLFMGLVSLVGAGALLENAVFLLLFYTLWLVCIYAGGARQVLREGQEEFRSAWYRRFLPWVYETVSLPLVEARSRLNEKSSQLDGIEKALTAELDRISQG